MKIDKLRPGKKPKNREPCPGNHSLFNDLLIFKKLEKEDNYSYRLLFFDPSDFLVGKIKISGPAF